MPLFFRIAEAPVPEGMEKEDNNLLKESFRLFYDKQGAGFLNFIRKVCAGDEATARDIFQESFLRLFRSSPRGLNEYQLKSYLFKTAFRLMVDEKRKKKPGPLDDHFQVDSAMAQDVDLRIDVARAFGRLDQRSRTLLMLAHVEGYSHREISEMTGIKEKSLKVTLYRARKKFAKTLEPLGSQDGGNDAQR